jgi:ATP-dependent Clp protease ATP-binding subunit ClpA
VGSCLSSDTGARLVIGYIEKNILPELGRLWLNTIANKTPIHKIELTEKEDAISFTVV